MNNENIGIVILATNAYFILGVRLIKRFMQFYKGEKKIKFFFFSDLDPKDYLPESVDCEYHYTSNSSWVEGVHLKFSSILSLKNSDVSHLFFFDADTNVRQPFTEEWFLGDMVGGQHFGDQTWMKEVKNYDRYPASAAYVPFDTALPQMYYYGAFFGGTKDNMMSFCKKMIEWQEHDRKIKYEPSVNDESYLNKEFHYNPPTKVVMCSDFKFVVSDKGSLGETRNTNMDVSQQKTMLLTYRNQNIDIIDGKVVIT